MAELFGREQHEIKGPITGDKVQISIGDQLVADAFQFQLNYNRPIQRRYALGSNTAIIYGGNPMGTISIARLVTGSAKDLLSSVLFECLGGDITFSGKDCNEGEINFTARGCVVSGYSLSASSDDLTVMDNISIEFLELTTE